MFRLEEIDCANHSAKGRYKLIPRKELDLIGLSPDVAGNDVRIIKAGRTVVLKNKMSVTSDRDVLLVIHRMYGPAVGIWWVYYDDRYDLGVDFKYLQVGNSLVVPGLAHIGNGNDNYLVDSYRMQLACGIKSAVLFRPRTASVQSDKVESAISMNCNVDYRVFSSDSDYRDNMEAIASLLIMKANGKGKITKGEKDEII